MVMVMLISLLTARILHGSKTEDLMAQKSSLHSGVICKGQNWQVTQPHPQQLTGTTMACLISSLVQKTAIFT